MIQIDTTNILFICGGAFVGIDKVIERRIETKSIGFGAEIKKSEKEKNIGEILQQVMPEDFVKFGLIPELIGRIPIVTSLNELDEDALVRILTEPKNSLVKQYTRLFELDGVKLVIGEDALREIAHETVTRRTGARGLRAIMEKTVMDAMYHVPSDETITECVVTKESVDGKHPVTFIRGRKAALPENSGKRTLARKEKRTFQSEE